MVIDGYGGLYIMIMGDCRGLWTVIAELEVINHIHGLLVKIIFIIQLASAYVDSMQRASRDLLQCSADCSASARL